MQMKLIRFTHKYPPYNVGEIAAFPVERAEDLVRNSRAVYHAEAKAGKAAPVVEQVAETTAPVEETIEIVEAGTAEASDPGPAAVEGSDDPTKTVKPKLELKNRGKKAEAEVETKDKATS